MLIFQVDYVDFDVCAPICAPASQLSQISGSTALVELIHVCGVPRNGTTINYHHLECQMMPNTSKVLEIYRQMMEIS